jgi:hypothetical protein
MTGGELAGRREAAFRSSLGIALDKRDLGPRLGQIPGGGNPDHASPEHRDAHAESLTAGPAAFKRKGATTVSPSYADGGAVWTFGATPASAWASWSRL